MPNTKETVRALIRAFNVHNYARDTVETNLSLQSRDGKDCIVVSFNKSMDHYQCRRYLSDVKRKIVHEFYNFEDTDEAVLSIAKKYFNAESFPFDTSRGEWYEDNNRLEFVTPIDESVIFNLKSHLASSLAKDVLEDMQVGSTTISFNKEKYLWHGEFPSAKLRKQFESEFSSRIKGRYKSFPKKLLKVQGNDVYIRDVFDDVRFIDNVAQYTARLIGMDLGVSNNVDHRVKLFKGMIVGYIYQSTKVVIDGFMCASPLGVKEASVLIPVMQICKGIRFMKKEEARIINSAFGYTVLNDVSGRTQAELSVNGDNEIYGIDFSNLEISHCVITKIIENSVINKNHELTINPELHFRALSPLPDKQLLNGHSYDGGGQGSSSEPPEKKSGILSSFRRRFSGSKSTLTSPIHESEPSGSGIKRQTPLTSSQRRELYSVLSPEMKEKFKSSHFSSEEENLLYLIYVDKRELRVLLTPEKEEIRQLRLSQLAAEHLLVGESGNRNSQALSSSGYGSEPSPGSSPESSLDSVDIAKFIQQCQEKQGDRVY